MRKIIVIVTLFFVSIATAQSPEVQAKAAFMSAQEYYGNGDYAGAIERLDNVKELLGSSNPRVEYLLCQSHFANRDAEKAEAALKNYFEMADESDPNYNQMLLMIEEIKTKKEEYARLREEQAADEEAWSNARELNSGESYMSYMEAFPEGKYYVQAKSNFLKLPAIPFIDPRDGDQYKTVRVSGLNWMTENLNYDHSNSHCYDQDPKNCDQYGRLYGSAAKSAICPEGWRLPTLLEVKATMEKLGNISLNVTYLLNNRKTAYKRLVEGTRMNLQMGGATLPGKGQSGKDVEEGKTGLYWASDGVWGISRNMISRQFQSIPAAYCRCVRGEMIELPEKEEMSKADEEKMQEVMKMMLQLKGKN